ncbi:hypothetical protein N7476_004668 [Penicillium atrosanguineum]|uniref:Uncharacterized protein n=1 Tax=Penicillium atrosanguineum TaxID=1132637 RepID=A0A9W9PXV6_9EURO|nr:hypothetical protein N7526_001796 [Penicillium atrosanguineum]KAJ5318248.1 hypothetical protein N7476_004668 [Penicillium atrosanguineum]
MPTADYFHAYAYKHGKDDHLNRSGEEGRRLPLARNSITCKCGWKLEQGGNAMAGLSSNLCTGSFLSLLAVDTNTEVNEHYEDN